MEISIKVDEDFINKIECLIGYVKSAGEGRYPIGESTLVDVAEEAQEWIDKLKL